MLNKYYCKKCGNNIPQHSIKCPYCGNQLLLGNIKNKIAIIIGTITTAYSCFFIINILFSKELASYMPIITTLYMFVFMAANIFGWIFNFNLYKKQKTRNLVVGAVLCSIGTLLSLVALFLVHQR